MRFGTAALRAARAQRAPVPLLTINTHGTAPLLPTAHLAVQAGSVLLAPLACQVPRSSRDPTTIPFWPWLLEWPELDFRYAVQDRRVEIAAVDVTISADAHLPAALVSATQATYRLDLWFPGTTLTDVVPAMAGTLIGAPTVQADGSVRVALVDGTPAVQKQFPAGVIAAEDFPSAPQGIVGNRPRQTVFGPFPTRLLCVPLDSDGVHFYVCDPPASVKPALVYIDGRQLDDAQALIEDATARTGYDYTVLTLKRPSEESGPLGEVAVSHGIGIDAVGVIEGLAAYAGILTDAVSQAYLRRLDLLFPMSALLNASADAWELIRDRFAPQTDCAAYMRLGQMRLLPVRPVSGRYFTLGGNLRARELDVTQPTWVLANDIIVRAGRDHAGSSESTGAPLLTIRRSAESGSMAMQQLARRSMTKYGRLSLPPVDALDLQVHDSLDGQARSAAAERLADTLLMTHALAPQLWRYQALWADGLSVEVGDGAFLTDENEGLDEEPAIIVRQWCGPTGPVLEFLTGCALWTGAV